MSDLISKLSDLRSQYNCFDECERDAYDTLSEAIKVLSAEPEQPSEIQDIIDYLDTVLHPIVSPDHWNVYSELHDMISRLPSAEPSSKRAWYQKGYRDGQVRMKGKWIEREEDMDGMTLQITRCSECGASKPMRIFSLENYEFNFCSNCGARMSEGEEDGL